MALKGWQDVELVNPRLGWSLTSQIRKGNPVRGGISKNVRCSPGIVGSRFGTSSVFGTSGKVPGMYNWINGEDDLVLFQDGTTIRRILISTMDIHDMLAGVSASAVPSFADLGPRVYFCAWKPDSSGDIQVRIHDGQEVSSVPNVDKAFRPPLSTAQLTGSASDGGSGQCTKGTHKIGFIYTNRTGYSGKPSPADGSSVLVPFSVTLNAGLRTISVSVTVGALLDGGPDTALVPIMTRADAPDTPWYFVPDGLYTPTDTSVPLNSGFSRTYTISVSDEDLAASATSALDQFSLLSQTMAGSGPILPTSVAAYGKRMCYVVGNKVYISDIDNPQAISEDRNVVEMLNRRIMQTVFPMGEGQNLFLTGDKWTGAVTDNGDFPSTWPQPRMVSGTLGAAFPDCIEWRTAGNYVWFVTELGVYLFDGAFPLRPITYLITNEWKRVNWAAAATIKIRDNVLEERVYVLVPLDGATVPTHIFVIDYTNGTTFDTCDISLDDLASHANLSSLCVVKEALDVTNMWIGPSAAGAVIHYDDGREDEGAGISSEWSSGLVRGDDGGPKLIRVGAADLWLRGEGNVLPILTWFNNDKTRSEVPTLLQGGCEVVTALVPNPGIEYQNKFDLNKTENFSFLIQLSGTLTGWWTLSGLKAYYKPSLSTR